MSLDLVLVNKVNVNEACEGLFSVYRKERAMIEEISKISEGYNSVMDYFFEGNARSLSIAKDRIFQSEGAIKALNAKFWQKAINLTGALELMPANQRTEWYNNIHEHNTPEFDAHTVLTTIENILMSRGEYFTDKVVGVFERFSDTHITNSPSGFTKRFILNRIISDWGSPNVSNTEYIDDLREIVCQVRGLSKPNKDSYHVLYRLTDNKIWGEWVSLDGNLLRVKIHKSGTAHFEIERETALMLNTIMANRYPMAIPAKFRREKNFKKHEFSQDLISSDVARDVYEACRYDKNEIYSSSKEVREVLLTLGAEDCGNYVRFDKVPVEAVTQVYLTRMIPSVKTSQFYPTKNELAEIMASMAEISSDHTVLEPSAGQGGLINHIKNYSDKVTAIELDPINALICQSNGHKVDQMDFIDFKTSEKFDRIVMNPPFSKGRAEQHVQKAFTHLKEDGVLVACLPASFKDKEIVKDAVHEYSEIYEDCFDRTKIRVVLLKITK